MKKQLLLLAAGLLSLSSWAGGLPGKAAPSGTFAFMPEAKFLKGKTIGNALTNQGAVRKLVSENVLPEGDVMGYLDGPNDETWYYVANFDYETGNSITAYHFTVYNAAFEEVANIDDETELAENETRVVDVQLGALVTRKFFNTDNSYEFMVAIAANTKDYVNHYYTKVYSQGVEECIDQYEGYYMAAVNAAADIWSENFFIGFVTEEEAEQSTIDGIINTVDYVFRIYSKAGYSSGPAAFNEIRIPGLLSAGENYVPLVVKAHNGEVWFAFNYLEKSYFVDPFDWENEELTEGNHLVIDLYKATRYQTGELTEVSKTKIPMTTSADDMNFYYLGTFSYDDDMSFDRYQTGAEPSFIVTVAHYVTSTDGYTYSYDVYSSGEDGGLLVSLAAGVESGTFMSDVRGHSPQVMFIRAEGEEYYFDFTDLVTGEVEHTLPYQIADGVALNADVDRVAYGNSYLYAASQLQGDVDSEGNVLHKEAYINTDGEVDHIDTLDMGQSVAYAMSYNEAYALNPYLFNTDNEREYMLLVKRYLSDGGSQTQEELLVVSPTKGILMQLEPDDELGTIAHITICNPGTDNQCLLVIYSNNYRYNTLKFNLPLTRFAGGEGTADNPYKIATIGDLEQIKYDLNACYEIVGDIDGDGVEMQSVSGTFCGVLDGKGYNINGINLYGHGIFEEICSVDPSQPGSEGGVVKNLNIVRPYFCGNDEESGMLASQTRGATITDVRIYDAKVECEAGASGSFGGIVGAASLYTTISGCSVENADIYLPDSNVGGIVATTRTTTGISACAFTGSITGGSSVGGIVGSFENAADYIYDCHVNADIKAKNTVGGIAGYSNRGVIERCHVQGSIEATEAPRWGNGPAAGGIVGELSTDWTATADVDPVIKGCFVNLSSLMSFAVEDEPAFEGEFDSMHRIVGKTCANEEPDPIYDGQGNVVGYGDAIVEYALADNYAVSTLAKVDENIEDGTATTEGKSVTDEELDADFFTALGYVYGTDNTAPWNSEIPASPSLYFEGGILFFSEAAIEVEVGKECTLALSLAGGVLSEDDVESVTVEIADEDVLELVGVTYSSDGINVVVKGLAKGATELVATLNGKSATAEVSVMEGASVGSLVAETVPAYFDGRVVYADGCTISVYDLMGVRMLRVADVCGLDGLSGGVYVVVAEDHDGNRATLKISLRL